MSKADRLKATVPLGLMQEKKATYLLERGGHLVKGVVSIMMPNEDIAHIDQHGRVIWDYREQR